MEDSTTIHLLSRHHSYHFDRSPESPEIPVSASNRQQPPLIFSPQHRSSLHIEAVVGISIENCFNLLNAYKRFNRFVAAV
ncbi:hypothetical protein L1987_75538 [Smallanthus sonchifolius]|uniref:Uncharacterized protein n=1 Tax=Smallanthus sonchifolius TaxID=185202 RepID=A0ACB9A7G6_9ASTR|nr:hypothetical protein L1987_75538 [Smallanthus sonchifolius]